MSAYLNCKKLKSAMIMAISESISTERQLGAVTGSFKVSAVGMTLLAYGEAKGIESIDYLDYSIYDQVFGEGGYMLASLEDKISRNLPHEKSILWPLRFTEAISPGADLS